MQCLLYKNRLVEGNSTLNNIPDYSNLFLIIQGYGGYPECEMCFGESNFFCADCGQYLCRECNERVHRHPKRKHHSPTTLSSGEDTLVSYDETTDEYDMDLSPSLKSSFFDAELVATLAERFQLTSFRKFLKTIIEATLERRDTLVLHPTGSGKSLCFQFRHVHLRKKALIVTPAISLMQDQVQRLNSCGIQSIYLGSAQYDENAEASAFGPTTNECLIFVTQSGFVSHPIKRKYNHYKKQKVLL